MSYMRISEITETAVSWIDDNGYTYNYREDRDIQFSEREDNYFGIEYDEDEE